MDDKNSAKGSKSMPAEQAESVRTFLRGMIKDQFGGRIDKTAEALGVQKSMVYGVIARTKGPGMKLLSAMATTSGVPIDEIVGHPKARRFSLPIADQANSCYPEPSQVLYVGPLPDGRSKNCVNCALWVVSGSCLIHAPSLRIGTEAVCGYHVGGTPQQTRLLQGKTDYVDPATSGLALVPGGTSCDNCSYYDDGVCRGVRDGNRFARVDPKGCCARWTAIPFTIDGSAEDEAEASDVEEAQLSLLLAPRGKFANVGAERGPFPAHGLARWISDHGSVRYVWLEHSVPVAALQVMSREAGVGRATNVYTDPSRRRKGLARKLLEAARRDFPTLTLSDDVTAAGRAWKQAILETDPNER